jgi:hypothetical protein
MLLGETLGCWNSIILMVFHFCMLIAFVFSNRLLRPVVSSPAQ